MKNTVRNTACAALLAVGFLSAGAFAGHHDTAPIAGNQNVTVILKQSSPAA